MEFYPDRTATKVSAVTLGFWVMKVLATTLGETGGDAVSMSLGLGYLTGTAIFAAVFLLAVFVQIKSERFHPIIYWVTIIATTTVGTTLSDYCTRSLGIGYAGGSLLLLSLLFGCMAVWQKVTGTISVSSITSTKAEGFYWLTIMFSQTLGTALGDWTADTAGLGYAGAAVIYSTLLVIIATLYFRTKLSAVLLFWAAFVLTRPLGAVAGDFLDKPLDHGGLAFSRYTASIALVVVMMICGFVFKQRAADHAH